MVRRRASEDEWVDFLVEMNKLTSSDLSTVASVVSPPGDPGKRGHLTSRQELRGAHRAAEDETISTTESFREISERVVTTARPSDDRTIIHDQAVDFRKIAERVRIRAPQRYEPAQCDTRQCASQQKQESSHDRYWSR